MSNQSSHTNRKYDFRNNESANDDIDSIFEESNDADIHDRIYDSDNEIINDNINDDINDNRNKPLYHGAEITVSDSMLLILSFLPHHNLTMLLLIL